MNDQTQDLTGVEDWKPSDEDVQGMLEARQLWQNGEINQGIDGDADTAAHAVRLSDQTGVPAPVINSNYDDFVAQQKKIAAQHIVGGNPDLESYIMSQPLATTVSNDDWAALDKFTRESQARSWAPTLRPKIIDDIVDEALKEGGAGIQEGFGQGVQFTDTEAQYLSPKTNPYGILGAAATTAVLGPMDIAARLMNAVGGGIEGAAGGVGTAIGGEQLGREARGVVESEFSRGMAEAGLHAHPIEPAKAAEPFLRAGEEVPEAVHPQIDAVKAQTNQVYLDAINNDLTNAVSTATRERSPEMFSDITKRLYKDSEISLGADAVLGLYGDKAPEPDDGILGWVPGIEQQLAEAREIGSDIKVPMADWMARVDPALAKGLAEDTRVWPGGITAREATVLPQEAKGIVDEPLTIWRASMGAEPRFGMGDRKLTLVKGAVEAGDQFHPEAHNFDIQDENGQSVGNMSILPETDGKTLYVDWIGGQAGLWANSFGPALMRDLKRQLKTQYPDYEYLTGRRVSGAREAVDNFGPMPLPRVRLDSPFGEGEDPVSDFRKASAVFENGWYRWGNTEINRQEAGFFTPAEQQLGNAVSAEVERLTGGKAKVVLAAGIRGEDGQPIHGLYAPTMTSKPHIVLNLLGDDPMGTARHEPIHLLRDYNVLTGGEWGTLSKAAADEGWLDRYGIHKRYAHLDDESKIEEAIAEGFREWAAQAPEARPKTGVGAIFQKLMDFFDGIKKRLGFGAEDSWQDVFQRIQSGEVGAREAGAPRVPEAFDLRTKFSQGEAPGEVERALPLAEGLANVQAQSVGLPRATFDKLMNALKARHEEDLAKAQRVAEREQAKRLTAEWKSNRVEVAAKVSREIRQKPDIAADLFIGSGELYGEKVQQRFTLAQDGLTPEQRAALPEHYVSKNGLDPDHVAGLFGYSSGGEMVDAIAALQKLKVNEAGKPMRMSDWMRKAVQTETDRQMEAKYGNLPENILDAAKDQALSDSSINLHLEELMAMAQKAGVTVYSGEVLRNTAADIVAKMPIGKMNSFRTMQDMGRHSRNAEKAILDGNFADAVVHLQRQTLTHMVARQVADMEKQVRNFQRDAKRWGKYKFGGMKSSVPADYANVIQQALTQIGMKVDVSPEWLAREMRESGAGTDVRSFVDDKMKYGAIIEPWEELYDPRFRAEFKDLTGEQFDRADGFLRTLVKAGRDEKALTIAGETYDFEANVKPQLIAGLARLGTVWEGVAVKTVRTGAALLLQHENYIDRWDQWDIKGPWNQYFYLPLKRADNQKFLRAREVARGIQDIINTDLPKGDIKNTIFRNPRTGELLDTPREALWAAMLNQGNADNIKHFASGWSVPKLKYKVTPEMVREWIDANATKEDWDGVQKIWDSLKKTGDWSDQTYRNISGRAMKFIEPRAVETQFGTYRGGYYPKMFHPDYPGKSARLLGLSDKALFGSGYSTGFMPGAGYRIERTDYSAPLALDLKQLPGRMMQQIHDGAMRESLIGAAKILKDPDIRDAIIQHSGRETYDMFTGWVRRIANAASPSADMGTAARRALATGDFIRRNVITNLVGLNPGTVEKHAPTALFNSIQQVGVWPMLKAYTEIWGTDEETGLQMRTMIHEKFPEIARRNRGWMENLYGNVEGLHSDKGLLGKFLRARDWMQWAASKPVALSDGLSAEPMCLAEYRRAKAAGETEGDAIDMAEKLVRKAHGSTSVTSQPMVMNEFTKWFTPMYNFYNDVFNRAVESYWRAGEAKRAFKEGDYSRMAENMKLAAVGGFVSLVMPAVIHNIVDPPQTKPDDSMATRALKYVVHPYMSFFPFARDLAPFIMGEDSPDVGVLTTAFKQAGQFPKDMMNKHAFQDPTHVEKLWKDGGTWLGFLTGAPGTQMGRWASGLYGMGAGVEQPQGLVGAHDLFRFGTTRGHARTLEEYMQGGYDRRR